MATCIQKNNIRHLSIDRTFFMSIDDETSSRKRPLQNMDDFILDYSNACFMFTRVFRNLGSEQYFFQHDPSPRQIIHGTRIREGNNTLSPHLEIHKKAYQIRPDIGVCALATPTILLGCLSGGLIPTPLLWEEAVRELEMTLPLISYENWRQWKNNSDLERALQNADVICIPHVGVFCCRWVLWSNIVSTSSCRTFGPHNDYCKTNWKGKSLNARTSKSPHTSGKKTFLFQIIKVKTSTKFAKRND